MKERINELKKSNTKFSAILNNLTAQHTNPNLKESIGLYHHEQDATPKQDTGVNEAIEDVQQEVSDDSTIDAEPLDVPGSELDDEREKVGSEDEENNYYSLGGDHHDN